MALLGLGAIIDLLLDGFFQSYVLMSSLHPFRLDIEQIPLML